MGGGAWEGPEGNDLHPDLFSIGPLTIHSYGAMMALGMLAGVWLVRRLAARSGQDAQALVDLAVFAFVAGLVGARIVHVLLDLPYFLDDPARLLKFWEGGLAFYGGPALAVPVAFIYMKRKRLSPWRSVDTIVPALALGQAFGRVGCLLNGCCYGKPCELPWAITFHNPLSPAYIEAGPVPLQPTQVYSAVGLLCLTGLLLVAYRKKRWHGEVFCLYLVGYGALRFGLEFFRANTSGFSVAGFTAGQCVSLAAATAGAVGLSVGARRGERSECCESRHPAS